MDTYRKNKSREGCKKHVQGFDDETIQELLQPIQEPIRNEVRGQNGVIDGHCASKTERQEESVSNGQRVAGISVNGHQGYIQQ
jgi:hypothetical protein